METQHMMSRNHIKKFQGPCVLPWAMPHFSTKFCLKCFRTLSVNLKYPNKTNQPTAAGASTTSLIVVVWQLLVDGNKRKQAHRPHPSTECRVIAVQYYHGRWWDQILIRTVNTHWHSAVVEYETAVQCNPPDMYYKSTLCIDSLIHHFVDPYSLLSGNILASRASLWNFHSSSSDMRF